MLGFGSISQRYEIWKLTRELRKLQEEKAQLKKEIKMLEIMLKEEARNKCDTY